MIEANASTMAEEFNVFLDKVEHGEIVRIRKNGTAVACLVPECAFISGADAAELFRTYKAEICDREASDAIVAEIRRLDAESDHALAH